MFNSFLAREHGIQNRSMEPKFILLVEDNPSDEEMIRRAFQKSHIANRLIAGPHFARFEIASGRRTGSARADTGRQAQAPDSRCNLDIFR